MLFFFYLLTYCICHLWLWEYYIKQTAARAGNVHSFSYFMHRPIWYVESKYVLNALQFCTNACVCVYSYVMTTTIVIIICYVFIEMWNRIKKEKKNKKIIDMPEHSTESINSKHTTIDSHRRCNLLCLFGIQFQFNFNPICFSLMMDSFNEGKHRRQQYMFRVRRHPSRINSTPTKLYDRSTRASSGHCQMYDIRFVCVDTQSNL